MYPQYIKNKVAYVIKEYSAPEWGIVGYYYKPIKEDDPYNLYIESDGGSSSSIVSEEVDADDLWKDKIGRTRDFWNDWIINKNSPKVARIDGKHYYVGDAHISSPINGFSGRWFTIEFTSTKRRVRTCDLWYQGKIPPGLRKVLPDNAIFIEDQIKPFKFKG